MAMSLQAYTQNVHIQTPSRVERDRGGLDNTPASSLDRDSAFECAHSACKPVNSWPCFLPAGDWVISEVRQVAASGAVNSGAQYASGRRARSVLDDAREKVAELLVCFSSRGIQRPDAQGQCGSHGRRDAHKNATVNPHREARS